MLVWRIKYFSFRVAESILKSFIYKKYNKSSRKTTFIVFGCGLSLILKDLAADVPIFDCVRCFETVNLFYTTASYLFSGTENLSFSTIGGGLRKSLIYFLLIDDHFNQHIISAQVLESNIVHRI